MAGISQFGAVKQEVGGGFTVSEFVTSLKSAVQNAEEALVSREDQFKREIEEKKKENEFLEQKFQLQVLEKLRLEKEFKELKGWASLLIEERDGLSNRLKENEVNQKEVIELKVKNCELECEKLRAMTDLDVYQRRFKELEGRVLRLEKDFEMLSRLEKNPQAEIEKDASVNLGSSNPCIGKKRKAGEDFVKNEAINQSDFEMLSRLEKNPQAEIEKDASVNLGSSNPGCLIDYREKKKSRGRFCEE
ncbi:uncharacterized protein [Euphorbia lathyris]|uniref:uncharacterized protein isoform X2 n=1 Tax=Euphorbia lathyris TaxID=212925 RepID=UPI0033141CDD